jgi:hypothetical protein
MNKIKEIHASHLYGTVIETGCATAAVSKILEVAGASKTIFRSEQPYCKEYEEELYGSFSRSVSKDFIEAVLVKEGKRTNINFVLASSWQLCDSNDPLKYAHGWFGLFDKTNNVKHYLHYTFRRDNMYAYRNKYNNNYIGSVPTFKNDSHKKDYYLNIENIKEEQYQEDRTNVIKIIGELGVNLLHTAISGNINELSNTLYGTVLDMAYIENDVNYDLLMNTLEKSSMDYFLVFDNNSPIRIEDLMRRGDEFIINKGSFNPLQHGHIALMNGSLANHPKAVPAFLISTFRYDKPHISGDEIKERIHTINAAGYPLIVCNSIKYYDTFDMLNVWSKGKTFVFPLGTDTINRIYETDVNYVVEWNLPDGIGRASAKKTIEGYIAERIEYSCENVKFSLFNRLGYERLEGTNLYNSIIETNDREDDGVSSTKIRNGELPLEIFVVDRNPILE